MNTAQLYRHFDKDGRLLYVGASLHAVWRLQGHSEQSAWFDQIARIEIENFPNKQKALVAESNAIRDEKPLYNINGGRRGNPYKGKELNLLQHYLSETGTSQAELARQLGIHASAVSGWVSGRIQPGTSKLKKLSQLTGIKIEDLL